MTLPTITVLAAAALASCSGSQTSQQRVCVDAQQNIIDQRQCSEPGGVGHYYYYSSGSGFSSSDIGTHVFGGSFSSHGSSGAATAAANAATVGRGGFGGRGAAE